LSTKNNYPLPVRVGNVTVKIYRSAHSRARTGWVYSIATRADDGSRKLIQLSDEGAAYEKAVEIATALNAGEGDSASLSKSDLRELRAARQICNGYPLLSALQEWARIHALAGPHGVAAAELWASEHGKSASASASASKVKIKDAVPAFIADKDADGAQGTQTYKRKLATLIRNFGDRLISEVSEPELTALLQSIKDPVSRNDIRKRCLTFWKWARDKKGLMPANMRMPVERTTRAKEPPRRIGIITPADFKRCLEWTRANQPDDLAALVLAGFCGIRSDEIHGKRHNRDLRQIWADIHPGQKILNVTAAKENTPSWRLVPFCDAAAAWLKICARRADGNICRSSAMEWVRKGCIAAGIALPENCFRHSFISHRIAILDGNKPQVATEAGNSVKEIDKRYRVPLTKERGAAWFAIMP
jgi:integrase